MAGVKKAAVRGTKTTRTAVPKKTGVKKTPAKMGAAAKAATGGAGKVQKGGRMQGKMSGDSEAGGN